jgi:S1-C subfamily serine protease
MQQVSGFDKHSIQGDAKFKDAAHSDWTLAADSPALTIGYKPFPLDSFGVQNGRLKPAAQAAFAAFTATSEQATAGPRDETVRDFMGGKVKNLTGEKSRLGLYSASGVLVVEAPAGSALQIAHAIPGDVILAWDKDPVTDWTALAKLSAATASPTIITVWRDFAKLMLWR